MAEIQARLIAKQNNTSGVSPLPADLETGELAVNTADGNLFTKHTDGSVVPITDTVLGTNGFDGYRDFEFYGIPDDGATTTTFSLPIPENKEGDLLVATFFAVADTLTDIPVIPSGWTFFSDGQSNNMSLTDDVPQRSNTDARYQSMWLAYRRVTTPLSGTLDITIPESNLAEGSIISISNCAFPNQVTHANNTSTTVSLNRSTACAEDAHHLVLSHWAVSANGAAQQDNFTMSELAWLTPTPYEGKRYSMGYISPTVASAANSTFNHKLTTTTQSNSTHYMIVVVFPKFAQEGVTIEAPVTSVNGQIGNVDLGVEDLNNVDVAPVVYGEYGTEISPVTGAAGEWSVSGTVINVSSTDSSGKLMSGRIQDLSAGDTVWLSADGAAWVTRTLASAPIVPSAIAVLELLTVWTPTSSTLYLSTVDPLATTPGAKPGDVLLWNEEAQVWEAGRVATPISVVNDLLDIDTETTPPAENEFLQWNGSQWVPGVPTSDVGVTAINGLTGNVVFGTNQLNDFLSVQDPDEYYYHDNVDTQAPGDAGQWRATSATEYEVYPIDTDLVDHSAEFAAMNASDPFFIAGDTRVYTEATLASAPTLQSGGYYAFTLQAPGVTGPTTEAAYFAKTDPSTPIAAAPEDKQVMTWSQSGGYWRPDLKVPTNLYELEDVVTDSPAEGEGLVWDGSTSRWVNGTPTSVIDLTLSLDENNPFYIKVTGPGNNTGEYTDITGSEENMAGMFVIPGQTYRFVRGLNVGDTDQIQLKTAGNTLVTDALNNPSVSSADDLVFTVPTLTHTLRYYRVYIGSSTYVILPIAKPHDSRQSVLAYAQFKVRQGVNWSFEDMCAVSYNVGSLSRLNQGVYQIGLQSVTNSREISDSGVYVPAFSPVVTPFTTSTTLDPFVRWNVSIYDVGSSLFKVEFFNTVSGVAEDPDMFSVAVFGEGPADPHFGPIVGAAPPRFERLP